jgi:arylsulfatase A-like enzyme
MAKAWASTARRHGVFLYDSTLRIPFILAGPGVPRGKVIADQARSIDVMPTLLAFLNLQPGPQVQGEPLACHPARDPRAPELLFTARRSIPASMGWSELFAMRTDTWKLIVAPHPELYNLERDPDESHNLISQFPADADELRKKLSEVANPGRQEKSPSARLTGNTSRVGIVGLCRRGTPRQIQLGTKAPDPKNRVDMLRLLSQAEDS